MKNQQKSHKNKRLLRTRASVLVMSFTLAASAVAQPEQAVAQPEQAIAHPTKTAADVKKMVAYILSFK